MKELVAKIDSFMGLDNVRRADRSGKNFFQGFENADVDNEGSVRLRLGKESVYSGNVAQIMTDGTDLLFREGTYVKRMNKDGTASDVMLLCTEEPFATLRINDHLYFMNHGDAAVYRFGELRPFGVDNPPVPNVHSTTGDLPLGKYLIAVTYLRDDGQESGASDTVYFDCTEGGFEIDGLMPSNCRYVVAVKVYISAPNGEVMFHALTLPNTVEGLDEHWIFGQKPGGGHGHGNPMGYVEGWEGVVLRGGLRTDGGVLPTQNMNRMPFGSLMAFYHGRFYVARGNVLYYSNPWQYELTSLDHNYFPFESEITMVTAVEGGLWCGTKSKVFFLAGDDPESEGGMRIKTTVGCGAVKYTGTKVDAATVPISKIPVGDVAIWASTSGIYAGDGAGGYVDMTGAYFASPTADGVASLIYKGDGMDQFLFSLASRNNSGSGGIVVAGSGEGTTI